jgi:maltooligosyltrehalose trehalohydrolase
MPIGAECVPGGGVDFRVWAPKRARVDVVVDGPGRAGTFPMEREDGGYFRAVVPSAAAGTTYRFRLDEGGLYPDPASREQPEGPHGPSRVVDPSTFRWTDGEFPGVPEAGHVVYEMHLGTFTPEGTWSAAAEQLDELARLGITILELMPIAEFSGRWGWGYDGVSLFAPTHLYGSPDDARRFVDRAHALGVAVILDVVYNHLGPDGNYLPVFSDGYFTDRYETDWGAALDFDGPNAAGTRELVLGNAAYWVRELHFDGLRLDATQNIYDASPDHILAAIARAVRRAGGRRRTYLVAENEPQDTRLVRLPHGDAGGYGLDAMWNDDFHHAARVALTGQAEAYYSDYAGTAQELVAALKWGFLYQGQRSTWQSKPRGTPSLDLSPESFVTFLENHDQLANSGHGQRLHAITSPARHRALTALWLLGPATPMFFQGQEFAASSPFLFFADQPQELTQPIRDGRREFLAQFPSLASPEAAAALPLPDATSTFTRCKLDLRERDTNAAAYAFHRDLLALRKTDPIIGQRHGRATFDGAALSTRALALRFFGPGGDDRLVLVNLGPDTRLARLAEPLLAPPRGKAWEKLLSTEDAKYGGHGAGALDGPDGIWRLRAEHTLVLRAVAADEAR